MRSLVLPATTNEKSGPSCSPWLRSTARNTVEVPPRTLAAPSTASLPLKSAKLLISGWTMMPNTALSASPATIASGPPCSTAVIVTSPELLAIS